MYAKQQVYDVSNALQWCPDSHFRCEQCPVYKPGKSCQNELMASKMLKDLWEELEKVQKNLEMAAADIKKLAYECDNYTSCSVCVKEKDICNNCSFEWRGVKE